MKDKEQFVINYQHTWEQVRHLVDNIFERQYYTNHGPELNALESELESLYPGDVALGISNPDIALLIGLVAMDIKNRVIVPSIVPSFVLQALHLLNIEPLFAPVDSRTGVLDLDNIDQNNLKSSTAIIVVNLLGITIDSQKLLILQKESELPIIFISLDSFGQVPCHTEAQNFIEIFSFHESTFINGVNGACIRTRDKVLAEKLRNIRSSYGAREKVKIPFTGNGRMSEIQAGLTRISLSEIENTREKNRKVYFYFSQKLNSLENFEVVNLEKYNSNSNYSKVIFRMNNGDSIDVDTINTKTTEINYRVYKAQSLGYSINEEDTGAGSYNYCTYLVPVPSEFIQEDIDEFFKYLGENWRLN